MHQAAKDRPLGKKLPEIIGKLDDSLLVKEWLRPNVPFPVYDTIVPTWLILLSWTICVVERDTEHRKWNIDKRSVLRSERTSFFVVVRIWPNLWRFDQVSRISADLETFSVRWHLGCHNHSGGEISVRKLDRHFEDMARSDKNWISKGGDVVRRSIFRFLRSCRLSFPLCFTLPGCVQHKMQLTRAKTRLTDNTIHWIQPG